MPISKAQLKKRLEEDKREAVKEGYLRVEADSLLAYSLKGHKGPFRLALARQTDEGFVTSVKHLDGSEINLSWRRDVKRWVITNSRLTKPPEIVLEELGDMQVEELKEITEALRPYVIEEKHE